MCGIVGYSGPKEPLPILIAGLSRLEYRGYDSAGVAVSDGRKLTIEKKEGKLDALKEHLGNKKINGNIGIGHTRWATHGVPNDTNAHPHSDNSEEFAIIHNGIIENYAEMKEELLKESYKFKSDTDTEVVAVELSKQWTGNLLETVTNVSKNLEGTYALVVTTTKQENTIVAGNTANELGLDVITFSGRDKDNRLRSLGKVNFWVDSHAYNIVECIHMIWITTVIDSIIGTDTYEVS